MHRTGGFVIFKSTVLHSHIPSIPGLVLGLRVMQAMKEYTYMIDLAFRGKTPSNASDKARQSKATL
jgi:hypothetical protein